VGGGESELDVLLLLNAHKERRDVDHLALDAATTQNTCQSLQSASY
jgi:hypothetical protein